MAETGKLGIADSLLANVQLAFAAADAAPPSITTESGRLGGQLGDTTLALGGVVGPLTFHLSAESTLVLAQTADPAPTFVAHPSPHWTLGGQDSKLGAMEPAFTGAADPLPAITTQNGRLGGQPGTTVLALGGAVGPGVIHLTAESILAIAQTADPAPVFAPHASRHWALGGQDSRLGVIELAFAGAPDPRPLTGSRTGKLGTVGSSLANMRLALGEQEGESTAAIIYATAQSALSLTAAAGFAVVRAAAATSAITLSDAAARNNLLAATAQSTLSLTTEAGRNNLLSAAAESTLSLDVAAAFTVARAAAAENDITLLDAAGRNNLLAAGAESPISLDTMAAFAVARTVAAESLLELTDEAGSTGQVTAQVAAQSAIDLETAAAFTVARAAAATSAIMLSDAAGRNNLLAASAESTLGLTAAAGRNNLLAANAESTLSLAAAAGRNNLLAASALSTLSLGTTALQVGRLLEAAATSAIELTDAATGMDVVEVVGEVWDWIPLMDMAEVVVVRSLSARSTIALAQAEQTARPWYLSAESPIQVASYEYDQQTDTFYPTYEGLQDSAAVARPLTAAVQQSIPLTQSASAVRVKPNAIDVSAESVLELLGEIRTNQTGQAGDWLVLGQTATVDKCKLVKSALELVAEAAVARERAARRSLGVGLEAGSNVSHSLSRRSPAVSSVRRGRGIGFADASARDGWGI